MSDERNLGVRITATDAGGTASLKQLQATLQALQAQQAVFASQTTGYAAAAAAAIQKETNAVQAQIAAMTGVAAAKGAAAAANVELAASETVAADASAALSRQMRHAIALFDEFKRGQIGAMFSSLGAAARDAGFGIGALATTMGVLAAVGVGIGILRGVENLGKWAVSVRAAADATGLSVNQFTRLDGAMQLLGGHALGIDAAMRNFARSLATANAQPVSQAAQAFHALGISQQEIASMQGNVYAALLRTADAWSHATDSENKAAAGAVLFRGRLESIDPLLRQGATGVQALGDQTERYGNTLNDVSARSLEEVDRKYNEVTQSIEGYWKRLVIGISGAMSSLGSIMSAGAAAEAASMAGAAGPGIGPSPGGTGIIPLPPVPGPEDVHPRGLFDVGAIRGEESVIGEVEDKVREAQLAVWQSAKTSAEGRVAAEKAVIAVLTEEAQRLIDAHAPPSDVANVQRRLAEEQIQLRETQLSQGAQAAKQDYETFAANERLKITEAGRDAATISNIYDQWLSHVAEVYGFDSAEFAKVQKEKEKAAQEFADALARQQMQAMRQYASEASAQMQAQKIMSEFGAASAKGGGGGLATAEADAQAAAQQILATGQQEIAVYEAIASSADVSAQVQTEAWQEVTRASTNTMQQLLENYKTIAAAAQKAAKDSTKPFREFFDQVGTQVDQFTKSMFQAMMSVGRTRQQDIRRAWTGLWSGLASDLFDAIQKALSAAIAQKLLGGAVGQGVGDVIGSKVGGLLGVATGGSQGAQFGITTANLQLFSAALVKATTFLTTHGVATQADQVSTTTNTASTTGNTVATTGNSTSTAADSITTGGSTTAMTANTVAVSADTAAMAANAANSAASTGLLFTMGMFLERGGVVPSAAGGMVVGGMGGGIMSILHPKEMVLPAPLSLGIQDIIARGGVANDSIPDVHFHMHANDGQSVANLFKNHGSAMAASFANEIRRNNRTMLGAATMAARGML